MRIYNYKNRYVLFYWYIIWNSSEYLLGELNSFRIQPKLFELFDWTIHSAMDSNLKQIPNKNLAQEQVIAIMPFSLALVG